MNRPMQWFHRLSPAETERYPLLRLTLRYCAAVLAVAASFALRQWLTARVGPGLPTYITFYPAVMAVAVLAGFWPGVLTTILASFAVAYWVLPPEGEFRVASNVDRLGLLIFNGMGLFMCLVAELYHRSRQKAVAYDKEESLREVRQEREFLANLLEHASQAFAVGYSDGRLGRVNSAFEQLTGYSTAELRSIDWSTVLTPPEWREMEKQKLDELHRTGEPVRYEKECIRKDGSRVPIELLVHLAKDSEGRPEYYYSFLTDITKRKRAETELRESHDRLKRVLEVEAVGVMFWDLATGKLVDANDAFLKLMGYSRSDVESRTLTWQKFTPPEYHDISLAEVRKFQATGRVGPYEKEYFRKDGTRQWLLFSGSSLGDSSCVEFCIDISDRKKAEEALRQSEERFRTMANAIPQLAWIANADGFIRWYNDRWYEYTGTRPDQMEGWGWQSVHDPRELPKVLDRWKASIATGAPFDMTFPLRRADGVFRPFLTRVMPLKDADGQVRQWFGTNTDVTEQKRAEEVLRQSEARVRTKLESILSPAGDVGNLELADILDTPAIQALIENFYELAPIPMAIIDLEGQVLVGVGWQEVCTKYHRLHPESCKHCIESDTQLTADVPPGEFRVYKCKNNMWDVATPIIVGNRKVGNLFTGQFFFDDEPVDLEPFRAQARRYGFDEQPYLAALQAVPRLSRATVDAAMSFFTHLAQMISLISYSNIKLARSISERDSLIEERRQAEQSLRQSEERLKASLGEKEVLLKEIHHRVKNNMQVVSSLVALQADRLSDAAMRDVLQDVSHRVRSMALVHEKLYQSADMACVEFAEYAQSLLNYLWRSHGEGAAEIHITTDLQPVSLSVNAAVPCGLILNELVSNALKHAFRGRGESANGAAIQPAVAVSLRANPNGRVCLRVRDNGVGLPADFDWRKADTLGLRLVQMLAGQIHATVEVASNEGTEFAVAIGGPKNTENQEL